MHRLDESAEILQLSDFDRLVYVISFIEHYPARDCATLSGKAAAGRRGRAESGCRSGHRIQAEVAPRLSSVTHISLPRHPVKKHSGLMAHAGVFPLELQEHRDLCLDCNYECDLAGNGR
jgi:hypothetical protein